MPKKRATRSSSIHGRKPMTKAQYERVLPPLRDALLAAQKRMQDDKSFSLAVIVTGRPSAGRSETVNEFLEWLDPKHIRVHALDKLRDVSGAWPAMWRYWNTLPARGQIAFFFMGWYEDYVDPALRQPKKFRRHAQRTVERITQFEAMLARDGVRVLKLHFDISAKLEQQRIRELRASKLTRWRVTREERWLARHYKEATEVANEVMQATGQPGLEWNVIDGADPQSRSFAAGRLLLDALGKGIHKSKAPRPAERISVRAPRRPFPTSPPEGRVEDDVYDVELQRLQGRFALLARKDRFAKHGAVFAFEGMDAAGKGGAIRRLTSALDARQYNVVPVSAPTPDELARPHLWRFWRNIPQKGEIAIFDRTWYGRVLVERVRGFAAKEDWQRAYEEINEFEHQLTEHGLIVQKFWLSVSKAEQLRRFEERDNDKLKRYKVDPEDWVNRKLYDQYQLAAHEMIARTDTELAPWTVVEADDKKYARLKVLRTVCEQIEQRLA